jgi:hypothetical protein
MQFHKTLVLCLRWVLVAVAFVVLYLTEVGRGYSTWYTLSFFATAGICVWIYSHWTVRLVSEDISVGKTVNLAARVIASAMPMAFELFLVKPFLEI